MSNIPGQNNFDSGKLNENRSLIQYGKECIVIFYQWQFNR